VCQFQLPHQVVAQTAAADSDSLQQVACAITFRRAVGGRAGIKYVFPAAVDRQVFRNVVNFAFFGRGGRIRFGVIYGRIFLG